MAPPLEVSQQVSKNVHLSRPKDEVVLFSTVQKYITTKICTANVENIKVVGKMQEIISYMNKNGITLFVGTECRADFSHFVSQEYLCLQSGDVVFILGPGLTRSWSHFIPFSERVASIDIRIKGGWATFIGLYFPYEKHTPENEQARFDASFELSEAICRIRHPGPRFVLGDFNTSFTYRNPDEHDVLGPFLFNPRPPLPSNYVTNHTLLVSAFQRAEMVLRATFIQKPQLKRITFYAKGSIPTHVYSTIFNSYGDGEHDLYPPPFLDHTHYREIDHLAVGSKYAKSVCNVVPDQHTRIGMSTHHPLVIHLKLPPVDRLKKQSTTRIPRLAWKDPACLGVAQEELRKAAAEFRDLVCATPTSAREGTLCYFERLNFKQIPMEGFPDIGIEISIDGGYVPPSDDQQERASFAFVVLAGIPPRTGTALSELPAETPREEVLHHPRVKNRRLLFQRYGPVILAHTDPRFIGVSKLSSHSAELTGMVEALLFLHVEASFLLNRPILFTFDSKNAGNQTSGDWPVKKPRLLADSALARVLSASKVSAQWQVGQVAHSLWNLLDADANYIYGNWVKGHRFDFANGLADDGATLGLEGFSPSARRYTLGEAMPEIQATARNRPHGRQGPAADIADTPPPEIQEVSLERGFFPTPNLPPSIDVSFKSERFSPEALYSLFNKLHAKVGAPIKKKIPKKKVKYGWQSLSLQRLADERDREWKRGNIERADSLTVQLKKQSKFEKRKHIMWTTEKQGGIDWEGPKKMKPFKKSPIRLIDPVSKQVVPIEERAEIIAQHYLRSQWAAPQSAVPLPPRPPRRPPLEIPQSLFSPVELRVALKQLKLQKEGGDDGISNDFIRHMCEFREFFSAVLWMMNDVWDSNTVPREWWVARIVAIYKGKKLPVQDPGSFRPVALLQSFYKLYTKLLELRLAPAFHPHICPEQFGFLPLLSTQYAIFAALRLSELARQYRNFPLYILLLDWDKCYDRIQWEPMLHGLRRMGLPEKYVSVLSGIYSNMQFYVGDQFGNSNVYPQATGLRQGDPLSCLLCIVLLTLIMQDAEDLWNFKLEQLKLLPFQTNMGDTIQKTAGREFFIYADDTNCFASLPQKLKAMLHSIQIEGERYGFIIKLKDAAYLRLGAARALPAIVLKDIHGRELPEKELADTLGFELGQGASIKQFVKKRSLQMLGAMQTYRFLWRAHLPLKRLIQKYFALVVSKAMHGVQVVAISDEHLATLESMHSRCLRRILNVKAAYISRVSNKTVRRRAKAVTMHTFVRRLQYDLLRTIILLPDLHPLRMVVFEPFTDLEQRVPALPYSANNNRKLVRGRPRKTWYSILVPPLLQRFSYSHITILANDKDRWDKTISCLCSNAAQPQ